MTTAALDKIQAMTGHYVGLLGFDLFHFNVDHQWPILDAVPAAIAHWQKGGIVMLTTHMGNPTTLGGVQDTNINGADLLTAGTTTNSNFIRFLAGVGDAAQRLQDAGAPLIYRLFHEAGPSQGWFWWGNLSQAQFISAWRYVVNYLRVTRGLQNILMAFTGEGSLAWWPGDDVVDLDGQDSYGSNPLNAVGRYQMFGGTGKPQMMAEFGAGSPSGNDPNFDLRVLVSALKNNMPNIVLVQFWQGWGIELDQHAAEALSDPWMKNLGDLGDRGQGGVAPPPPVQPVVTRPTVPVYLTPGSASGVLDASGLTWTLSPDGHALCNLVADPNGGGTSLLTAINGVIWGQDAKSQSWYCKLGGIWVKQAGAPAGAPGPTTPPVVIPPIVVPPPPGTTITRGTWLQFDLVGGPVLPSGKQMHFDLLPPPNYDPTKKFPVLVHLHENDEGNEWYQTGVDNLPGKSGADGWYNNTNFRALYPCFILLAHCDQTSDPGGALENFGGWSGPGDHGPNEDAVIAGVRTVLAKYTGADPNGVGVTGNSLGGIASMAMAIDYNNKNGPFGKVFAASMPFAGTIERYFSQIPDSLAAQLSVVPMFAVSGAGDTTSNPNDFPRPLWRKLAGNDKYPQMPPGAQAGTSEYHYLEDPGLGHNVWDTYRPLPRGAFLYDWLFKKLAASVTVPVSPPVIVVPPVIPPVILPPPPVIAPPPAITRASLQAQIDAITVLLASVRASLAALS